MNNVTVTDLKKIISNKKKILIISHYNPDGDAIGSSFGLANYCESIGIEAHVYNRDQVPIYLNFLATKNFHNSVKTIPDHIDLYMLLDFNDLERSGDEMMAYLQKILNHKKPAIIIDHHENNKIKSANLFIDSKASSTGCLLYTSPSPRDRG